MEADKDKKYTYDEFVEGLRRGDIRLSVPVLTGMNGARYQRVPPKQECAAGDKWVHLQFKHYDETFSVPSVITEKGGTWFQGAPLLRGLHLAMTDSEVSGMLSSLSLYLRSFSPFNLGQAKRFIHESALPLLGYNTDRGIIYNEQIEIFKELVDAPMVSYSDKLGVPYYDVDFIGGFNSIFNNQVAIPEYNIVYPPFKDADVWCNVKGDSMNPRINEGDIIALKEVQFNDIVYGEIYALVLSNDLRTIKIVKRGSDKLKLKLTPINPYYNDIEIDIRTIIKVFLVMGSIRKFF